MTTTLKMILKLENGKTTTMSLSQPRPNLTKKEVDDFLDSLIAAKAVMVESSRVASVKKIYLHDASDRELA